MEWQRVAVSDLYSTIYYIHTDTYLDATKQLYLDSGGNTYIVESSGDVMQLVAGGSANLTVTTTTITINGQTVSFGRMIVSLQAIAQ